MPRLQRKTPDELKVKLFREKEILFKKMKEKQCKNPECKKKFVPQRPLQMVCDYLCGLKYAKAVAAKKEERQSRGRMNVLREKLKTLSEYESEARKVFQKWIVKARDAKRPCIACGSQNADEYNGSHYFEAGQFSGLIFDEMNVHKCCVYCNKHRHGNLLMYREGLILRYGEKYLSELESKKEAGRNYKFTKDELIEIKKQYQDKLKPIK